MARLQAQLAASEASDRDFGLLMGVVLAGIGLFPLLSRHPVKWWLVGLGFSFALIGLLALSVLNRPKQAWLLLGFAIGMIVNPIVLIFLFAFVITPVGLLARMTGRDPLRLRLNPAASTYWVAKPETKIAMIEQF